MGDVKPMYLDGMVAVQRSWYERAVRVMDGKEGCPFCGSTKEPYRTRNKPSIEAGVNTIGCLDCGRWFD